MATKNNPGEFDCYKAAEPDEPIFILKSTDEIAPAIVENWAFNYLRSKGKDITPTQLAKYKEALKCASDMREWKERKDITQWHT